MQPEKIRALCSPDRPLEHTVLLVKELMKLDRYLDVQMAELLLGRSNFALDQRCAMRALEVLDQITVGPRLVRMVGQLLSHENPHIRSKAAMVVGRRVEGWMWIHSQLATAEPRVRANVVEALWHSGHPLCVAVFSRYRDDDDNRVAGNALYGLYLQGDPGVIPCVLRMAGHADPKFRGTAAWLMGKIGQPGLAEPLRGMLGDKDRHVKGIALKALVRINRAASRPDAGASGGTGAAGCETSTPDN